MVTVIVQTGTGSGVIAFFLTHLLTYFPGYHPGGNEKTHPSAARMGFFAAFCAEKRMKNPTRTKLFKKTQIDVKNTHKAVQNAS